MIEFLLEIIGIIVEPILEALLEFIAGICLDVFGSLFAGAFEVLEKMPHYIAAVAYVTLGALAGGCTLLILPHHLVHPSRIPGVSLVLSPLLAGTALSLAGSFLRSRNKPTTRIETFRYGYTFAFGMALIRLLFAH